MTRRLHRRARCGTCGLHLKLCVCDTLPRLDTRTRVVIVRHWREGRRTSNTARLACACLPTCSVVTYGGPDAASSLAPPLPSSLWPAKTAAAVLFPSPDAVPFASWCAGVGAPVTLIVPDGTWGQTSRIRQRLVAQTGLPCVALPDGPPSAYRLRAIDRSSRLSTLEALARALAVLEGPAVGAALERVLAVVVDRTLWMRGRLDRADVTGGIPDGVQRHFAP